MSEPTMFVRPAEGLIVRDPGTREALPAKGKKVPRTSYWLRRLKDGDLLEAGQKKAAQKSSDKSKGDQ